MSKSYKAMRDAPDNAWRLDNCVNLPPRYKTQHRGWRPFRMGRVVYGDPGFQNYTICGRLMSVAAGCHPGPRCGVCFRGTEDFSADRPAG